MVHIMLNIIIIRIHYALCFLSLLLKDNGYNKAVLLMSIIHQ